MLPYHSEIEKKHCISSSVGVKLSREPPVNLIKILTYACVIGSKLTLLLEITRVEAFTWKQRYLAPKGYPHFAIEISHGPEIPRSHVNDHALDQGDV